MGECFLYGQGGSSESSSELGFSYTLYSGSPAKTLTFERPLKAIIVTPYYSYTTSKKVYYYQGVTVMYPQSGLFIWWGSSNTTPSNYTYNFKGQKWYYYLTDTAISKLYATQEQTNMYSFTISNDLKQIILEDTGKYGSDNRFIFVY